jgi:hypothetical protein
MYKRLFVFLFLFFSLLFAQQNGTGSIHGFVYDRSNMETLIGANVYISELAIGGSTNFSGYFIIPEVPAGNYTIICEYIGYQTFTKKIKIEKNEKRRIQIMLNEEILSIKTIVVEAESIRTVEKLFNQPVSQVDLSQIQIKKVPQIAEADLLRSLQTLPGILPISDFSSELYIRGGTPDQNLYMIDGADVYNPEHAFGIFSTFNTDAVKHINLSKGGFGAEYGGRLSSIMDVTYLDGNREEFEGSFSLSLISAKTTLQTPMGKKGSISGSLRRTYYDQTVAKIIDDLPNYYFYDANLKAFYEADANNKFMFSVFRGRDVLDFIFNEDSDEDVGFKFNWGNTTGSVRWTRVFSPQFFANFWITASHFSSNFNFEGGMDVDQKNTLTDLSLKGNFEYAHSNQFFSVYGFEQKNLHGVFEEHFPLGMVDVDAYRKHYVLYYQSNWKPTGRWDIKGGIRYNYFDSQRDFQNIDPRLSVKYRLTGTTNLKISTGLYHQYLHRISAAFITSVWTSSDRYQKESSAFHFITGFQKEIADDFFFEIESYYKKFNSIYQFNNTFFTEITAKGHTADGSTIYNDTQSLFNHGNGNSIGLELFVRKDSGILTGWFGYSLARTEYQFYQINKNRYYPPRHDRTSTVNLVSNFNIKDFIRYLKGKKENHNSSKWLFGMNFIFASGQPITMPNFAYTSTTTPDMPGSSPMQAPGDLVSYSFYPVQINQYRLPPYIRMDISLTYEKHYKSWTLSPYLQIFNVGNRKNVWFIQYNDEKIPGIFNLDAETISMLPLLPTIGVDVKF